MTEVIRGASVRSRTTRTRKSTSARKRRSARAKRTPYAQAALDKVLRPRAARHAAKQNGIDPGIARLRSVPGLLGKIAKALKVNKQATSKWQRVPAERVLEVARISGFSPTELRADIYPHGIQITPPVNDS